MYDKPTLGSGGLVFADTAGCAPCYTPPRHENPQERVPTIGQTPYMLTSDCGNSGRDSAGNAQGPAEVVATAKSPEAEE